MLPFRLNSSAGLKLLFLGAHCDDIEIGCGGTVLRLAAEYPVEQVKWIVFTSTEERRREAEESAGSFLKDVPHRDITIAKFSDSLLPHQAADVKTFFEEIKKAFSPDVVFTHYRNDLHQDHRLINELTWNTFRNHLILEYEIQKYDGDLGNPSFFVPIDEEKAQRKVTAILEHFASQRSKHWFDRETFMSLMRIRGMESASRYAEAFYLRKAIF